MESVTYVRSRGDIVCIPNCLDCSRIITKKKRGRFSQDDAFSLSVFWQIRHQTNCYYRLSSLMQALQTQPAHDICHPKSRNGILVASLRISGDHEIRHLLFSTHLHSSYCLDLLPLYSSVMFLPGLPRHLFLELSGSHD